MSEYVEIVRLRVAPEHADRFVQLRAAADAALVQFKGFTGSQLLEGAGGLWTLHVHWASHADVLAAQAITLTDPGLPEIKQWVSSALELVSFETAQLHRDFRPASPFD